jgi:hypothetical protein
MSTDRSPINYAERIISVLHSADTNTARAALRIAETLLEHKVNAEAGAALPPPQPLSERSQVSVA